MFSYKDPRKADGEEETKNQETNFLDKLPHELLIYIFDLAGAQSIWVLRQSCKRFKKIVAVDEKLDRIKKQALYKLGQHRQTAKHKIIKSFRFFTSAVPY